MPRVKRMRRRRSGTWNMLRTAARNFSIKVNPAPGRERDKTLTADDRHGAASFFDLLPCTLGKTMGRNFQGLGNFAIAKHDNVVFRFLNDAAFVKHLRRNLVVCGKPLLQRLETDFDPLLFENVCEPALGQSAMQRHLPTFETYL